MNKRFERHPPETHCISRRTKEPGELLGWRVMIKRFNGSRAITFQKYFLDQHYGGEAQALAAAQAWRDDILRRNPRMSKEALSAKLRKHNTSGAPGVYRKTMRKLGKNGKVSIHAFWQAQTPLSVIPFKSQSFSIAKFGESEAFRQAVLARKEFEKLLANTA